MSIDEKHIPDSVRVGKKMIPKGTGNPFTDVENTISAAEVQKVTPEEHFRRSVKLKLENLGDKLSEHTEKTETRLNELNDSLEELKQEVHELVSDAKKVPKEELPKAWLDPSIDWYCKECGKKIGVGARRKHIFNCLGIKIKDPKVALEYYQNYPPEKVIPQVEASKKRRRKAKQDICLHCGEKVPHDRGNHLRTKHPDIKIDYQHVLDHFTSKGGS